MGTSFAGMHIVELAASEPGLAGAIAQCPLVDGLAGLANIPAARALRLAAYALADLAGSVLDRPPRYLPISVPPGQLGVIATDDAMVGMTRLDPGDGHLGPCGSKPALNAFAIAVEGQITAAR